MQKIRYYTIVMVFIDNLKGPKNLSMQSVKFKKKSKKFWQGPPSPAGARGEARIFSIILNFQLCIE